MLRVRAEEPCQSPLTAWTVLQNDVLQHGNSFALEGAGVLLVCGCRACRFLSFYQFIFCANPSVLL